jgi:acetylornithine deacetylase
MDQALAQISPGDADAAIARHAESVFAFLERIVAEPSVLGAEAGVQRLVAVELDRLGLDVDWMAIPPEIASDPIAGVPQLPYDGGDRRVLVARRGGAAPANGRSLLINGHLDVVPPGDVERWTSPPYTPTRRDGWLYGRGAGDMKAGWAMLVLALEGVAALRAPLAGELIVVGVIEEECTGNGTLASVRAGIGADAVLLPEPTDLDVLLHGIGVLWLEIVVDGRPGHAEAADGETNAFDGAWVVVGALRALAERYDADAPAGVRHRVNVGTLEGGDWPSTAPGSARLAIRVGFPPGMPPVDAEREARASIAAAAALDPWLSEQPPRVRLSGFRAEGYAVDPASEVVAALSAAHVAAHGKAPALVGTNATTDARFYVNQAGTPAICFGPRTRGMHGADEAVELASIVDGARTLARFIPAWTGVAQP